MPICAAAMAAALKNAHFNGNGTVKQQLAAAAAVAQQSLPPHSRSTPTGGQGEANHATTAAGTTTTGPAGATLGRLRVTPRLTELVDQLGVRVTHVRVVMVLLATLSGSRDIAVGTPIAVLASEGESAEDALAAAGGEVAADTQAAASAAPDAAPAMAEGSEDGGKSGAAQAVPAAAPAARTGCSRPHPASSGRSCAGAAPSR